MWSTGLRPPGARKPDGDGDLACVEISWGLLIRVSDLSTVQILQGAQGRHQSEGTGFFFPGGSGIGAAIAVFPFFFLYFSTTPV